MDLFFLCWAFDRRWLFNLKNPCLQLIFTAPFIVNLVSIAWICIQKNMYTQNQLPYLMETVVLLALLTISSLYLICIIRMNSAQKLSSIQDNHVAIQQFYHQYQTKKVIWSSIGLIITIISVCSTVVQSQYISRNYKVYPCMAVKFRFYVDVFFQAYILLNILIFLIVKAVYLITAWVCCPRLYLRLKQIID